MTPTPLIVKNNLKNWIAGYKMINDSVDILDGVIINYAIQYKIIADFKFRAGDGSVTFGSIEGRGEFSRLPPGGISISVDNSARNFKFRPDSTTTTNDKTVSIPQLYNDQITTKADGTLNYDGTTAVADLRTEAADINTIGKKLFENAGASTDPGGYYYIAATFNATGGTGGDMSFIIEYVIN